MLFCKLENKEMEDIELAPATPVGEKQHCAPLSEKQKNICLDITGSMFGIASGMLKLLVMIFFFIDMNSNAKDKDSMPIGILFHFSLLCDIVVIFVLYSRRDDVVLWLIDCGERWDTWCGRPINQNHLKKSVIFAVFAVSAATFITLAILRYDIPKLRGNNVFDGFLIGTGLVSFLLMATCGTHIVNFFN